MNKKLIRLDPLSNDGRYALRDNCFNRLYLVVAPQLFQVMLDVVFPYPPGLDDWAIATLRTLFP